MEKRKVSIIGISRLLPSTPGAYLGCLRGLLELGMVLSMGEGGPKQTLVDPGRLSNQVLHGFPLGPGLFRPAPQASHGCFRPGFATPPPRPRSSPEQTRGSA